jgi:hypothetical protein
MKLILLEEGKIVAVLDNPIWILDQIGAPTFFQHQRKLGRTWRLEADGSTSMQELQAINKRLQIIE